VEPGVERDETAAEQLCECEILRVVGLRPAEAIRELPGAVAQRSVPLTLSGAFPLVGLAVNDAVGALFSTFRTRWLSRSAT